MDEICLLALIGLPAVGKTSFCKLLLQIESVPFNVCHICYDEFIDISEENLVNYKEQRDKLLNTLDNLIGAWKSSKMINETLMKSCSAYKDNGRNRLLILCDDNHFYGSMRYRLYQIARKYGLSYGQIFFDCTLDLALQQNTVREGSHRVPEEVVTRMYTKLEVPDLKNNSWEQNTFTLATENLNKEYISLNLVPFIVRNFAVPLKPLEFPATCPTKQSQVHELDLLMRKHIGTVISKIPPNVNKKQIALVLNDSRKDILDDCKALEHLVDADIRNFLQLFEGKIESVLNGHKLAEDK
uniref:L-seryl-tRNA(Sec) kinase n=1 Tax=Musca domestica TaxID=7370 RepID=A0A1I8N3N2_MUSDO